MKVSLFAEMGEDSSKIHIKAVKELILDEQKFVTYISVSKDLCIHANNSKSVLRHVVDDIRSNHPNVNLSVSYLISGLLENNKARTAVCMETDLQNFRDAFQHIFFEHVYSINLGSHSVVDEAAFATISKFEDLALCTGHIKNDLCVKLSTNEICNLKSNSKYIVEPKPSLAPQKKITAEAKSLVDSKKSESSNYIKPQAIKSEPIGRSQTPSPKKDLNHAKKLTSKNGNKAQKGIAGFFNQSNVSNKVVKKEVVKIENVLIKDHQDVQEQSCVKQQSQVKQNQSDKKQEQSNVKQEPMDISESGESMNEQVQKKLNKKKEVLNNSLTKIKKQAKVDKKRKRVLHVSDSESEDEKNDPFADEPQANHDSDDEIPPTPSINAVKITSGIVNPKKRRKIVDKTYANEDGYIITKKEEVYESCSDNEEMGKKENLQTTNQIAAKIEISNQTAKTEISPKVKTSKKKVSPPQKGKQTNIMSFFKKH